MSWAPFVVSFRSSTTSSISRRSRPAVWSSTSIGSHSSRRCRTASRWSASARGHRPRTRAREALRRASRRPVDGRERGRQRKHVHVHAPDRDDQQTGGDRMTESPLVLIVEDNDKNLKLARDLLQFAGLRTLEAMTAEDGIALAQRDRPNIVLMDIQLPGMDGIAALRKLREDERTAAIPAVALTASVMKSDRERFDAAGFDGFMQKPVDVRTF